MKRKLYSERLMATGGKVGNLSHYAGKAVQPIDLVLAWNMSFPQGNVIKYVTRYKEKNGLEDLYKAKTYLQMLIDEEEVKQVANLGKPTLTAGLPIAIPPSPYFPKRTPLQEALRKGNTAYSRLNYEVSACVTNRR